MSRKHLTIVVGEKVVIGRFEAFELDVAMVVCLVEVIKGDGVWLGVVMLVVEIIEV